MTSETHLHFDQPVDQDGSHLRVEAGLHVHVVTEDELFLQVIETFALICRPESDPASNRPLVASVSKCPDLSVFEVVKDVFGIFRTQETVFRVLRVNVKLFWDLQNRQDASVKGQVSIQSEKKKTKKNVITCSYMLFTKVRWHFLDSRGRGRSHSYRFFCWGVGLLQRLLFLISARWLL